MDTSGGNDPSLKGGYSLSLKEDQLLQRSLRVELLLHIERSQLR